MRSIDEIRVEWQGWKATREKTPEKDKAKWNYADGMVDGLDLALKILKRPSNTRMQVDTKPKHHYRHCGVVRHKEDAEYCYKCGGALSD